MSDPVAGRKEAPKYRSLYWDNVAFPANIRTGILMVLREGDDVFAELEALMPAEQIPSASFVGFGFLRKVTFGFFDFEKRAYNPKTFKNVEMANMTGTLAWQDGRPSIHAHGVVCDRDFAAVGGHLLALEVGTGSVEITITLHPRRLERERDAALGANVLSLK